MNLVVLTDLLLLRTQEIVEIKDEHDFEEIEEIMNFKKTYDVSARLPVEDLEKRLVVILLMKKKKISIQ